MSGPVKPNPVPEWLRPENASVLDSPFEKAIKALASLLGATDPQSQVMGLLNPTETGKTTLGRLAEAVSGVYRGTHSLDRPELIRAASQGYDLQRIMWHETHKNNLESLLQEGFDLSRGRARMSDELMPDGVFLKPTGKPIGLTAEKIEAAQVPLMHRAERMKEFPDRDALKAFLTQDEEFKRLLAEAEFTDRSYIPQFDALEKVAYGTRAYENDPVSERARQELDELLEAWKRANDEAATRARTRGTQVFRDKGYDAIRVANDAGSFGRSVDTTVILDPEKVRSIYAAFDPAMKNSKSLLASLAAALGTGAVASHRQEQ